MKAKNILVVCLVIVVGAILTVVVNVNRPTAPAAVPVVARDQIPSATPPQETSSVPKVSQPEITAAVPLQPANPIKSAVVVKSLVQTEITSANQPLIINGYAVQDPTARAALSFVGADPDANAYWLGAIFDSSLPDQEREDLMEDLNEDGLSDPKHPGPQDLPLILNRRALIEEVAPYADPFMQEHLGEAYKDLNNMLAGKPVQ